MSLVELVKTNLVHYNNWTNVEAYTEDHALVLLKGIPPAKLAEGDQDQAVEWVVPKHMQQGHCSMEEIETWFSLVERVQKRPKRVTLALVNDDATVVYYFVHDGAVKPRQN